jgi:hypothetical protein
MCGDLTGARPLKFTTSLTTCGDPGSPHPFLRSAEMDERPTTPIIASNAKDPT